MERKRLGSRGEDIAEAYLLKRGFVSLARNIHLGHNEIDIVMRDGDTVVFIEVKSRSHTSHGLACEAVNSKKQAKLINAAKMYLQKCPDDTNARFDVVEVDLTHNMVNHIINAFTESQNNCRVNY